MTRTESPAAPSAAPSDTAPAATAFASLPLAPHTLQNLARLGYEAMTPIQAASLPLALAGHDLIAQAKTGSGKTAVSSKCGSSLSSDLMVLMATSFSKPRLPCRRASHTVAMPPEAMGVSSS